jgi:hypothetical protein
MFYINIWLYVIDLYGFYSCFFNGVKVLFIKIVVFVDKCHTHFKTHFKKLLQINYLYDIVNVLL